MGWSIIIEEVLFELWEKDELSGLLSWRLELLGDLETPIVLLIF